MVKAPSRLRSSNNHKKANGLVGSNGFRRQISVHTLGQEWKLRAPRWVRCLLFRYGEWGRPVVDGGRDRWAVVSSQSVSRREGLGKSEHLVFPIRNPMRQFRFDIEQRSDTIENGLITPLGRGGINVQTPSGLVPDEWALFSHPGNQTQSCCPRKKASKTLNNRRGLPLDSGWIEVASLDQYMDIRHAMDWDKPASLFGDLFLLQHSGEHQPRRASVVSAWKTLEF
uniref:Uncharacterized protein n=1 Tax=Coccidioides posadasii RMSCC 3488 TaxID=454284 RepID=A0A0J6FLI9_COCPO|nr:hypothetical protein CPAG_07515 [Coccidioides posadasii RMSCC 3488]